MRLNVEGHAASVRFVKNIRRNHLEGYRVFRLSPYVGQFVKVVRHPYGSGRYLVGGEKALRFLLGKDCSSLLTDAPDQRFQTVLGRRLIYRQFGRRLIKQFEISLILVHVKIGFDCLFRCVIGGDAVTDENFPRLGHSLPAHEGSNDGFWGLPSDGGNRLGKGAGVQSDPGVYR